MDLQLVSFIKCISILFLYGQYYYVQGDLKDAYDIYDYKTGELISKATKTPEQITEESKEILGMD